MNFHLLILKYCEYYHQIHTLYALRCNLQSMHSAIVFGTSFFFFFFIRSSIYQLYTLIKWLLNFKQIFQNETILEKKNAFHYQCLWDNEKKKICFWELNYLKWPIGPFLMECKFVGLGSLKKIEMKQFNAQS